MTLPLPVTGEHGWATKLNDAISAKADLIDGKVDLDQLPDYLGQLVLGDTFVPIGETYHSQSRYGIESDGSGDQATSLATLFTDSETDGIPSLVFGNVNTNTAMTVNRDVMLKGLPGATLTINDGGVGFTICPAAEVVATAPNAAAVGATVLTFPGENWLVNEHVGKWIEVTDPVIAASGNATVHPRRVVSNTATTVTLEYGIGYAIPASPTASGPVTTNFFTPLNRVWIEDVTIHRGTVGNGGSIVIKYAKDVRLNRLRVTDSGDYAGVKGNAVSIYSSDRVRAWDGEIVNAGNFGFFCYNSDDVEVYGQRVKGFGGQFGMQLKDCRDAFVLGGRVYGDGVKGDTGYNVKCSGLNPAKNIRLISCKESKSRVNGYELSSITTEGSGYVAEDFRIEACVSDSPATNGFTTITDATSLPLIRGWAWVDNTVRRAGSFGYLAPITGMEITGNNAALCNFEGMSISATDVVVRGGTMVDNSQAYVSGATRSSEILLNATCARTTLDRVRFVRTSAGKTIRAVREIAGANGTVISFCVIYHPSATGYSQDYLLSGADSQAYGDNGSDFFANSPTINKRNMRPIGLNVKDFGAKGDGTTDDTNAIQAAIDAASAAKGTVIFTPGKTYACAGDLVAKSDVTIELAAGVEILRTTSIAGPFLANASYSTKVNNFRVTGPGKISASSTAVTSQQVMFLYGDDIELSDFTIDTYAGGQAIVIAGDRNRVRFVKGLNPDPVAGVGGIRMCGGTDFLAIGCHVVSGDDSYQFTPIATVGHALVNMSIDKSYFIGCTGGSLAGRFMVSILSTSPPGSGGLTNSITDVGFADCHGFGANRGIVVTNTDSTGEIAGVSFTDCSVDMTGATANAQDVLVNRSTGTGRVRDISFTRVHVLAPAACAFGTTGSATSSIYVENVTLTDCVFEPSTTGLATVKPLAVDGFTIRGGRMEGSGSAHVIEGGTGVNASKDVNIVGVRITGIGNTFAGVRLPETVGFHVRDDHFVPSAGATTANGISLASASSRGVIEGNDFLDLPAAGVTGTIPVGTLVRNNLGYVTEGDGSDTIASGATSKAVTHGLASTPTRITVGRRTNEDIWISARNATTFTVTRTGTTGALTFDWSAIYRP